MVKSVVGLPERKVLKLTADIFIGSSFIEKRIESAIDFFGRNGNEIEPFIVNELDMKYLRNCLRERIFIYLRLTFQPDRFGVKRLVKRRGVVHSKKSSYTPQKKSEKNPKDTRIFLMI